MELKYYAGKDVLDALLDCMERIAKQDGADVVEVVRCKDCIYWDKEFCMISGIDRVETDYCSQGQRKEDEG